MSLPGDDIFEAGQGEGDKVWDGSQGQDSVTYPSVTTASPLSIDLREEDRSNNPTVVNLLETAPTGPYPATLPVGIGTTTGTEIGTHVYISVENVIAGAGNDSL